MTNKLFTIIFAIAIVMVPTFQKGSALKEKMQLLYTNMNDQQVLQELQQFAQEIFQIESSQDDLYEFLYEFLTKDLEEVSEIGQLDEEQQKQKIQQEIYETLKKHFDEKIANQEFDLDRENFKDAFDKVKDIYERYFLAILGRKIKSGDHDLRLPFDFTKQLFNQISALKDNEAFSNHYKKEKVQTINKYIQFLNENQKVFQDEYQEYLKTYANYAILVTDNYFQLAYDIDSFFATASEQMSEENREDMVRRIKGLTKVFIKLNDSGDAVSDEFRDRQEEDNEEDNRSDDEKKRDIKDYLLQRLKTIRIEFMDSEDEDKLLNLSFITGAAIEAFLENDKNAHIFYQMRQIFIQNIAISSSDSIQTKILKNMYKNWNGNANEIKEEAEKIGDDDIQPQVLFLADVLCTDIFQEEEQTKDYVPDAFRILYQKLLAIPAKTLQGNAALQLLGHYAVAPEGEEMEYYQQFYEIITKFRLQNNFNLNLLEDHFQTAIAMQFFINQQYSFESQHEQNSKLVQNYFKYKTTIILHMLAFVNKDDYTEEEEIDQLRQMYQVNYEQATDEELNEFLSKEYIVYRPGNVKTSLKKILKIFSEHWEEEEDVQNDEFEFTKEGLDMFSENTFNLIDVLGDGLKDHITVTLTQTEGVNKKLPLGLQSNFKIGFYGVDALHYKEAEKNNNQNAQEKQRQKNQDSEDSIDAQVLTDNEVKDIVSPTFKRQTSSNLPQNVSQNSDQQSSQESRNESDSQNVRSHSSQSKESVNDISEEDNEPLNNQSQKVKKQLGEISFGEPSTEELKLKKQNDLINRTKQAQGFSFGNSVESDNNEQKPKQGNPEINPFNTSNPDTSSEEDNVHQNNRSQDPTNKLQLEQTSSSDEETQLQNKTSSSDDETELQNKTNKDPRGQQPEFDSSSSQEEQVLNQSQNSQSVQSKQESSNSQEQVVDLNRINGDKVKNPINDVTYISGQPLNQKEEEYLQDPELMEKLKRNKDENNQVTFENDDGSITEIVYVQIIPYGSDCYESYQRALLDN